MTKDQEKAIECAIRESVESVVADFGIGFVRTLSMFPSAEVAQAETKLAA